MLEPLRNPANWDNFRKAAVLVLIIWAAASTVPSTSPLLRMSTMRKRRFIRLASLAGVSLDLGRRGGMAA